MKLTSWIFSIMCLPLLVISCPCKGEEISENDAHNIGVSAYLYFYPLISMDLTRQQMTNVEPGKSTLFGPINTILSAKEYPTADMKTVVRPNFDTLYSSAWLDLSEGPVTLTVPDTNGRYYLLPLLDMWTDVFASPGWRTTGTKAGNFLIALQGWKGEVPENTQLIYSPTPYVWMIGRIKTDGPSDYDVVHKLQDGLKITSTATITEGKEAGTFKIDPNVDMKTPPKEQVDSMSADKYFSYAAELLKKHPPHITDEPMIALLKRIGFEPGKSFDLNTAPTSIRDGLNKAVESAQKLMKSKLPTIAKVENGWSMNTDTMGVYGNYYLKRAIIAQEGLGANLPEDAIYPLNLYDNTGAALVGNHEYSIHFDKETLPPVDAFWSITLYDANGFQVANNLNRFALSSWMPFKYNEDGSLDLYFSNESPGSEKEANWLPAPKDAFNLTMRLYAPKSPALIGEWNPPVVNKK